MQGESNLRFMRKLGKKYPRSDRRALYVIALALVLPFAGVAGYRALERRQPTASPPQPRQLRFRISPRLRRLLNFPTLFARTRPLPMRSHATA